MTARATQGAVGALVTGTPNARVSQAAIGALISTVSTASPTRVSQAAIGVLVRAFPVDLILEVFPSQETHQTTQPKKRVDLI